MHEKRVSAVVVGERGDRLITEYDVVRAEADGVPPGAAALPFSSRIVLAADEDLSLGEAAAVMVAQGIRHLPVLSADGDVIGMLAMPELFRALLSGIDSVSWLADLDAALGERVDD